jgi:hypothetical protein
MGERHVVRESDGAQAMFSRFFIAPLIEESDGKPVMTGGIIVIDFQLPVESALGLLPFSQFQIGSAKLLLQVTDAQIENIAGASYRTTPGRGQLVQTMIAFVAWAWYYRRKRDTA